MSIILTTTIIIIVDLFYTYIQKEKWVILYTLVLLLLRSCVYRSSQMYMTTCK
ncbi:hypothetical protein J3Q64DRAFT_1729335 [Phycomyces blakesleeanus]|uniref:Uncharacterized protein n=1 Tax=Phycomyces blakesleeanus TaxID=4837 RepID=A0ABR3B8N4_PHYBL